MKSSFYKRFLFWGQLYSYTPFDANLHTFSLQLNILENTFEMNMFSVDILSKWIGSL